MFLFSDSIEVGRSVFYQFNNTIPMKVRVAWCSLVPRPLLYFSPQRGLGTRLPSVSSNDRVTLATAVVHTGPLNTLKQLHFVNLLLKLLGTNDCRTDLSCRLIPCTSFLSLHTANDRKLVQDLGTRLFIAVIISLQIARRKPASTFNLKSSANRVYKHLEFLPLTHIKSVINFVDNGGQLPPSQPIFEVDFIQIDLYT